MHERTQTREYDGKHYLYSGVTGQELEGPYPTAESAEMRARLRSQDPLPGLEMSDPGYAGARGSLAAAVFPQIVRPVYPDPTTPIYAAPPDARPPLGDPEAIEPRAYGRQAGPGRSSNALVALLLDWLRRGQGARPPTRAVARGFQGESSREG